MGHRGEGWACNIESSWGGWTGREKRVSGHVTIFRLFIQKTGRRPSLKHCLMLLQESCIQSKRVAKFGSSWEDPPSNRSKASNATCVPAPLRLILAAATMACLSEIMIPVGQSSVYFCKEREQQALRTSKPQMLLLQVLESVTAPAFQDVYH